MLVLTRRLNEGIVITIGDKEVKIIVNKISKNLIRLCISSPPEILVLRDELVGKEKKKRDD